MNGVCDCKLHAAERYCPPCSRPGLDPQDNYQLSAQRGGSNRAGDRNRKHARILTHIGPSLACVDQHWPELGQFGQHNWDTSVEFGVRRPKITPRMPPQASLEDCSPAVNQPALRPSGRRVSEGCRPIVFFPRKRCPWLGRCRPASDEVWRRPLTALRHHASRHDATTHAKRWGSRSLRRARCPARCRHVAATAVSHPGTVADRQSSSDHRAVRFANCGCLFCVWQLPKNCSPTFSFLGCEHRPKLAMHARTRALQHLVQRWCQSSCACRYVHDFPPRKFVASRHP